MHDVQLRRRRTADEHRQRELEARAAGIKAVATWHATAHHPDVPRGLRRRRLPGRVNRLPALKADTDVFTTFEGDNTVLLQLVAKGLLTDYRDSFGDLDTLGMVRFGAKQFAASGHRAHGGPRPRAAARRRARRAATARRATCSTAAGSSSCSRTASATCWRPSPCGCARPASPAPTCSRSSTTPRTTSSRPPAPTSTGWSLESFVAAIEACTDPAARAAARARLRPLRAEQHRAGPRPGTSSTAGITPARSKQVTGLGQRPLRHAAPARPGPRRRLRHPARLAGHRAARGAGLGLRPPTRGAAAGPRHHGRPASPPAPGGAGRRCARSRPASPPCRGPRPWRSPRPPRRRSRPSCP